MKAKVQARIYSSKKTKLEDVIPLETPFSTHIDVCSLCNLKCNFCFQADENAIKQKGLRRGLMDFKLFKKISDDLTEFNDKMRKVKIGLHGEPTMHPELPRMIKYLNSKKITEVIELFTNGSLLNPKLNRELMSAGLDRINISIEALTSEKYKEVTGVAINIDNLVANIRDLYNARGTCRIYIKIVDVEFSKADKQTFFDTFGDICDEIYIENVVPQWAETNKFEMETVGMYGQKVTKYKHVCPFIFMYLHFNYDGSASGCTLDWSKEVLIGDISKESALEIWNGEALRNLQIAHLKKQRDKIPFCNECMAPMVCCLEDLDDYTEELLEKIKNK